MINVIMFLSPRISPDRMDELVYLIRTQRRRLNTYYYPPEHLLLPPESYKLREGIKCEISALVNTVILHLKMCESKLFKE